MEMYASMYGTHGEPDQTYNMPLPMSSMEASSPNTASSMLVEMAGLAVVFSVMEGEKYFVLGEPLPEYASELNPASCGAFQHFEDFKVDSRYRWEGISLREGTMLYADCHKLSCDLAPFY